MAVLNPNPTPRDRPTGKYSQQLMLPHQLEFLQSKSHLLILTSARATGKSVAMGFKILILLSQGKDVIAAAPTYKMLKFTLLLAVEEALVACKIPYKYNKSDKTIKALGHTVYGLSGESFESGRGLTNISALIVDEAALVSKEAIEVWSACLRGKRVGTPDIILASTPRPRTTKAKWFWEYNQRPEAHVIHATTMDNYLISPEFAKSLKLLYGDTPFYDQEVLGLFIEIAAGILKSKWLKDNTFKRPKHLPVSNLVRAYDLAVSTNTKGDFTATTLMGKDKDLDDDAKTSYKIYDVKRYKLEWPDVRKEIIRNAYNDGVHVPILIEGFGTQKGLVQDLKRDPKLKKFKVYGVTPPGDKVSKAMPVAGKMSQGLVSICEDIEILEDVYNEMDEFDGTDKVHDDMVDSMALTYFGLDKNIPAMGVKQLKGLY